jgi:hypothetical protein
MDAYDEDAELVRYVNDHYYSLMTVLERLGQKAAFVEEKASRSSPGMAATLRRQWGAQNDPEVVAALTQGVDAFRARVAQRILRDHADEVFLNRCSACGRLTRTPRAQQCLWCGHDWHERGPQGP